MKKIIGLSLSFLLCGFSFLAAAQNAPQAFSLQQSIEYALQNHPQVKTKKNQEAIDKARVGEVRSMGLPQINAQADLGDNFVQQRSFLPAQFFGGPEGAFVPVTFTPVYTGTATLTGSQLLFDGSYLIGLKAAQTYTELSRKSTALTEIETVEMVSKAYYGVLVTRERMALLDQNLRRLDTLLYQTRIMYENGFAEKLDVDRLQVSFNNLKVDRQKTERLLEVSENLLKFQMGMNQNEKLELTDRLQDVEVQVEKADVSNFNYASRIEYSMLETQRDLAILDLKNRRAGYYPKLYLNSRYGWNAANNAFKELTTTANWLNFGYVGLSLQVPIFDGLRKHYSIRQAKLTIENTQLGFELLRNSIDVQLDNASTSLTNSMDVLESQRQNLALAEDIARVAKIKYQEGVGSNLEVITAETDLRQAQTNYYAALYDVLIAKVDLDKATGTLLTK